MLYILSGQDNFSLNVELEKIKKSIGNQEDLVTNTTILEGQQVTLDNLKNATETLPFLAKKRLVIVYGLLGRFQSKDRTARQKKTAGNPDEYQKFSSCLTQTPESTTTVLIEENIESDNPLFKELVKKSTIKTFPPVKGDDLAIWVQHKVTEEGATISPQAKNLMIKFIGSDLWTMSGEIKKLALFASGRRIEEQDVKTLVSYDAQGNVFALIDAIVENRVDLAEQLLEQLLVAGAAPSYLLVMLTRQVRLITRARELKTRGKANAEIQNKLGITNDFAFKKTIEQSTRYSLSQLKKIYGQLLATDLAIKTGKYDGDLALNILVADQKR